MQPISGQVAAGLLIGAVTVAAGLAAGGRLVVPASAGEAHLIDGAGVVALATMQRVIAGIDAGAVADLEVARGLVLATARDAYPVAGDPAAAAMVGIALHVDARAVAPAHLQRSQSSIAAGPRSSCAGRVHAVPVTDSTCDIAFMPAVRAVQPRRGSRAANPHMEARGGLFETAITAELLVAPKTISASARRSGWVPRSERVGCGAGLADW